MHVIWGFFIDSTCKTNRYRQPLLDFVGVTPTAMTFSAGFAYLEGERVNNIVWALERFQGLFLRNDRLPVVIITNRDLVLMNAVKIVFPEYTNLLCRFHIDKNVKAKCKFLIGQKNAWDYVLWLIVRPNNNSLSPFRNFKLLVHLGQCSLTMLMTHGLSPTRKNLLQPRRIRVLQNSLEDLCSVWDAMNNMITLQHVEIKASFETNTHVAGHVFKKTLYKRLVGMVSRNALNEIATEVERLHYLGNDPFSCGCVMRSTLGLPCACELSRYTAGSIPVDSVHMFWRKLCFSDQGLCEVEVSIKEEIKTISKRFEELDVCGKLTLKSKLRDIAYPDHNSMCPPPSKVNTKGAPKKPMKRSQRSTKRDPNSSVKRSASSSELPKPTRIILMLDQFAPFIQGFIHNVVDVKADGNCGYRSIAALLGMGEDSWSLVRNELIKELGRWLHDYTNLFDGTKRFKQLRFPYLLMVSVDKWMDIKEMRYVIASRSQPPPDSSMHRMICVDHVFGNHFVQVYLKDRCPLPPLALLRSTNCYSQAKQWPTSYISRMQQCTSLMSFKRDYVNLNED
ncbi:hypothetical protein GmHk_15G045039 [Glycine max]|nr:hypothetical protein GmHk_15G045039 [Glycine max]